MSTATVYFLKKVIIVRLNGGVTSIWGSRLNVHLNLKKVSRRRARESLCWVRYPTICNNVKLFISHDFKDINMIIVLICQVQFWANKANSIVTGDPNRKASIWWAAQILDKNWATDPNCETYTLLRIHSISCWKKNCYYYFLWLAN